MKKLAIFLSFVFIISYEMVEANEIESKEVFVSKRTMRLLKALKLRRKPPVSIITGFDDPDTSYEFNPLRRHYGFYKVNLIRRRNAVELVGDSGFIEESILILAEFDKLDITISDLNMKDAGSVYGLAKYLPLSCRRR